LEAGKLNRMSSFFLRYSIAALLGAILAGCGTGNTTIDVDDHNAFIPSARLTVPLSKLDEAPSEPQSGHALEIGYTQTKGSSSQSLAAGQDAVRFGGQTFNPPRELQYEFEYKHAELHYRYRKFLSSSPNLGFEALGGIVNSRLDLSASSSGQGAHERLSSAGISGGVGAIWKLRPATSLQARYSLFAASETRGNRTELSAVQALGANASIRGGYTWWYLRADTIGFDAGSEVAVRFRGPAVALDVMF
jgi:hypothetical protein